MRFLQERVKILLEASKVLPQGWWLMVITNQVFGKIGTVIIIKMGQMD